jgi:glycosyltransferase involved in cell wall biosynthesis
MASIDVAIPNYNYGRYLRPCVESVLKQDVPDLRILVIDNASEDESIEVAEQLASEDERVSLIRHRSNLGHQASFNEAIDWAEADHFMILCADDMLTEGSLARALGVMRQHPEVTLAFGELAANPPRQTGGRPKEPEPDWQLIPAEDLLRGCCRTGLYLVRSCSAVVRTAAQKRAGHYCGSLDQSDDFELMMRLTLQGGLIARTRTAQLYMRAHGGERSSVVRQNRHLQILAYEAAFEWFFSHEGAAHPEARELASLAARGLVGRAYWSGMSHLCRGDLRNAAGLFRYVVARSWSTALVPPLDYLLRKSLASDQAAVTDAMRRLLPARWV